MRRLEQSQSLLLVYSSLGGVGACLGIAWVISSPSEPTSAVILGLSALRLTLVVAMLFVLLVYAGLAFYTLHERDWAKEFLGRWVGMRWLSWCCWAAVGLGWVGCSLPPYRLGQWGGYWMRGQPVLALFFFLSLITLIFVAIVRNRAVLGRFHWGPLQYGLPLFGIGLFVIAVMLFTGFGIVAAEDFWYGAGVPILVAQAFLAILGGMVFLRFQTAWGLKRLDLYTCILLFAVTAFLWAREPLNRSFLFTGGPGDFNQEFYPFADAASFDTASQFPLIGEKFLFQKSIFFERPLYSGFLVYLHLLFGQEYETLMAAQAAVFAILPVLIYLSGRALDARAVGFGAALVALFRGVNSIAASNMIDMANPKMMLTDFPAAIGLAFVVLCLCEWLQAPAHRPQWAVWLGGALGATLLLRTNALLVLAFVPLWIFPRLADTWKRWLLVGVLVGLGTFAITLPWELRNLALGGQMYGPIVTKFRNVIDQRYGPASDSGQFLQPGDSRLSLVILDGTRLLSTLQASRLAGQDDQACDSVPCFSANHFLHNFLTSLLIFPTSPYLDDLRYLVKERHVAFWRSDWDGSFQEAAPLFLVVNMFLISTGIAVAWREKRLAGLTPLAIFFIYQLSNSLARTSGGRYIVPVDWILSIYYLFGAIYLVTWVAAELGTNWKLFDEAPKETPRAGSISKVLTALLLVAGFGSLIPLSEHVKPPRYQAMEPAQILAGNTLWLETAGLQTDEVNTFLQTPTAEILIGRALYPRYYNMGQGEVDFYFYPYVTMEFPRLAFKLVGPRGEYSVVLPGDMPAYFPHTADVVVLGCNGTDYFDALAAVVLGEDGAAYLRQPRSPLQCPLQQPVCTDNSVCR